MATSSLVLLAFIHLYQKYNNGKGLNLINLLFIIIIFVIPILLTINNNQSIINTFKYSFSNNDALKIQKVSKNKSEKTTFEAINYINQSMDPNSTIVIKDMPASFNFWLYIKNNRRIVKSEDAFYQNNQLPSNFYLLLNNQEISNEEEIKKGFNCFTEKELSYSTFWKCQK